MEFKTEFKTSEFRPAIIRMYELGKSKREIARDLGINDFAVRNTIKVCLRGFLNFFCRDLKRLEVTKIDLVGGEKRPREARRISSEPEGS